MLIAFIGSHGTGKTTTSQTLNKKLGKDWQVFEDAYRKQAKMLGYKRPRNIILDEPNKHITVTAMTGAALGALNNWSCQRNLHGIIDMGPPALLAYHRYWMKICDTPVSPFLLNLCQFISDQIDLYIYLPTDAIPLVSDNMRSDDPIFQKDIDQWIKVNLDELNIPEDKVLIPQSSILEERIEEILKRVIL